MRTSGHIIIRGIVQGVGFRPFVFSLASEMGITGTVKNIGSEVHIDASGDQFETFLEKISAGTPLSVIDSIEVLPLAVEKTNYFRITRSEPGTLTGLIPPDIATCPSCIRDIFTQGGRYEGYFGTSCVDCGPRYSIIRTLPYDRERTSMNAFPPCPGCNTEYHEPQSRRHHAQTIACDTCGPKLSLFTSSGEEIHDNNPIKRTAYLLDAGALVAIRGIGGFHIACTEESTIKLKTRLGRSLQPFAIMAPETVIRSIANLCPEEESLLTGPAAPILVLDKCDPQSHKKITNLHTIGCMLPYTGLHHLLFRELRSSLLIMTSANAPGYPMITDPREIMKKLRGTVDYILTHNRDIVNRCDDSVVRKGYIIRLSRGLAPQRTRLNLGRETILAVGPELNSNVTLYKDGFCITSPHVGNVRNPPTLAYLKETVKMLTDLLSPDIKIIAHDLHPQFLSTRLAREMAEDTGARLVPVQHHKAHIAAACQKPCIGIAIDGVGYGEDGTVWGGEIFAGEIPSMTRKAHLAPVLMPGGDAATKFPERMLYGVLPERETLDILSSRGWDDTDLGILERQVARRVNTISTTSTGRILDAASALLGICRVKTYDGEPAMRLESVATLGRPSRWDIPIITSDGMLVVDTPSILRRARQEYLKDPEDQKNIANIAASVQMNLAYAMAETALHIAAETGIPRVALSGGVAYNEAIRECIREKVTSSGLMLVMNKKYPLGDGCISYGQTIWAGILEKEE